MMVSGLILPWFGLDQFRYLGVEEKATQMPLMDIPKTVWVTL